MQITQGKKLLSITLEGRIYSKKNSRQLISQRIGKRGKKFRPISLPSKAYLSALPLFLQQIKQQNPLTKPLRIPVILSARLLTNKESWLDAFLKGNAYHGSIKGSDVDNKLASIGDMLVEAHVLTDDSQIVGVEVYKFPGERLHSGDQGAIVTLYEALFTMGD